MTNKRFITVYPNEAVERVNRAVELIERLRVGDVLTEAELEVIRMVIEERGGEIVYQESQGILESVF